MATIGDLCRDALLDIGVLAAGEPGTDDELQDALRAVNRLTDQWAAERLAIYTTTRTTFDITASDGTYTFGASSADVNIARPVFVEGVSILDSTGTEVALERLTDDAYRLIVAKSTESAIPSSYYWNPTYPNATLTFYPVPSTSDIDGVIYHPTAVTQWSALTTTVSLPPGYQRMIVKNLACELLPMYSKKPDPLLMQQAAEAKAVVKRANRRLMDMAVDPAALCSGGGGYSILVG